ncbi:MAG: hypothetical protein ACJAS1_000844 [Oleiphilaceae bacterium]
MSLEAESLEFYDDFRIHKLIFISSANSANVVIPMSESGALLGTNNLGKTSGISALKLFILPEVNFKNCKDKFGFVSNNQYYEAAESSQFYFPTDRSFIICEAENNKGIFCTILHRSNEEWGYARIMVPTQYENIKHLFWDFDCESNQGKGKNLESLSLKDVKDGLKTFKPDYLTKAAEIKEAIYTRPGSIDNLSRYCLIPMPNSGEQREVESLRSLMKLAFHISGKDALTGAISSIIETEYTGKKGTPSVDIVEINNEYNELKSQGELLTKIRSNQHVWTKLKQSYLDYRDKRDGFKKNIGVLLGHEATLKKRFSDLTFEANALLTESRDSASRAKKDYQAHRKDHHEIEVSLKVTKKRLQGKQEELDFYNFHESRNAPLVRESGKSLVEVLTDLIPELEADIQASESEAKEIERKEELNYQLGAMKIKIDDLKSVRDQDKRSTLESFDHHDRTVLYNLNKSLAGVTNPADEKQSETISEFSQLFNMDDGRLSFLGQHLHQISVAEYNPEKIRRERDDEIETLTKEYTNLMQKIKDISGSSKDASARAELIQEKADIEKVIEISPAYLKRDIEELSVEVEEKEIELPGAQDKMSKSWVTHDNLEREQESLSEKLKEYERQSRELKAETDKFNICKLGMSSDFEDLSLQNNIEPIVGGGGEVLLVSFIEMVDEFIELCSIMNNQKKIIADHLKQILKEGILVNQATIEYQATLTLDQVDIFYEGLRAVFDNYEENKTKFLRDIENHNNTTGVRAAAINEIGDMIQAFRNSVNKELSSYNISNLGSVEMQIELDPRFTALMGDLNNTNFTGNRLLDESVYKRLNEFCDEFFKNTSSHNKFIQIERVIKKVTYNVELNGVKKNDKQSHGTSININAAFLTLFLKRMVPAGVKLHFPIIVDEVLNLDSANLKTIKKLVEEYNFVLFVVSPEKAGFALSIMQKWYDLSIQSVRDGIIVSSCKGIHFDLTETLIYDQSENDAAIEGLLV